MTPKTYAIGGMDCANCAREVESAVGRLENVRRVQVDFATARMTVEGDVPLDVLRERVEAVGKTILDASRVSRAATHSGGVLGFMRYLLAQMPTRLALVGGGIILLTLAALLAGLSPQIANILFTAATLIALYPIAR
ncbi:MAG: cation transporter, partial [Anaerolineae bacterium]|nr:cation transporter [Anaerolineae bacterium]